jgi:hypothetical protein
MARHQQHVANSLGLPFNDMGGGLGWENRAGLCSRGGRGHSQDIVIAKPGGLINKGVTHSKHVAMGDVPCPLGKDTRQRKDVCRKGDILWVDGVFLIFLNQQFIMQCSNAVHGPIIQTVCTLRLRYALPVITQSDASGPPSGGQMQAETHEYSKTTSPF